MRRAVGFEWDERKALANQRTHKVDFADAATVFEDDRAVTAAEDDPREERYVTLGMMPWQDPGGRLHPAGRAYQDHFGGRATRREREEYELGL